jgi:cytochrome c551/c552
MVIAQFFQPGQTNPVSEAAYSLEAVARPKAEVDSILTRACRDCHSNDTVWPWYSKVAPASWLVVQDVQQGRAHLNFSDWGRFGPEIARTRLREMCEQVRGGSMSIWYYMPMHPAANLSETDVSTLCTSSLKEGQTEHATFGILDARSDPRTQSPAREMSRLEF